MTDFLILSLLSGIIELGSVYLGICQGLPLPLIVSLPLFYQVGNFLLHVFPQRVQITLSLAGIVCLLSIAYLLSPSFIIIIVQMVLSSYCIQFARSQYKSSCPTWLKRSFRVAGFALSPAMCWGHGQVVLLLCMALCIAFLAKKISGILKIF